MYVYGRASARQVLIGIQGKWVSIFRSIPEDARMAVQGDHVVLNRHLSINIPERLIYAKIFYQIFFLKKKTITKPAWSRITRGSFSIVSKISLFIPFLENLTTQLSKTGFSQRDLNRFFTEHLRTDSVFIIQQNDTVRRAV